MKAEEIREGDIVEIDYITEFTKEHINEGKALVIWKGFNNQPLVRKLDTKKAIWTCYEHIARVVGHIDIAGYMDRALSAEPCDDCISRQAVLDGLASIAKVKARSDAQKSLMGRIMFFVEQLPPVTPKEKTGHWVKTPKAVMGEGYMWYCDKCEHQVYQDTSRPYPSEKYCPDCGCHMIEPQESEDKE